MQKEVNNTPSCDFFPLCALQNRQYVLYMTKIILYETKTDVL